MRPYINQFPLFPWAASKSSSSTGPTGSVSSTGSVFSTGEAAVARSASSTATESSVVDGSGESLPDVDGVSTVSVCGSAVVSSISGDWTSSTGPTVTVDCSIQPAPPNTNAINRIAFIINVAELTPQADNTKGLKRNTTATSCLEFST